MTGRQAQPCRGYTENGEPCRRTTTNPSGFCGLCKGGRPASGAAPARAAAEDLGVFPYTSADSFRTALLAKSRNAAKADPTRDAQTRQRLFCFNRFLSRVFSHPEAADGNWALKGGASLMARLSEARMSKDIDIATRDSLADAERVLREAAAMDAGDFLRLEIREETDLQSATGKKFNVTTFCGARQLSSFKMDLSISTTFPDPDELDQAPRIESVDIPGLYDISYPSWPFPRVIADKVAACYETHNGIPSTRHRDLPDLYLLQSQIPFGRRRLRQAVLAELTKRGLEHPPEFRVPDRASWEKGWRNVTREDAPTLTSVPFAEGLGKVKAFLDPVLAEDVEGRWDPAAGRWVED